MAGWFGRKRALVTPTIDALSFDTSNWKYHGEQEPGRMRVWETAEGDAVALHFFGIAPDLPRVGSVRELSAFYAEGLALSGASVVECDVVQVADCPAVRLVIKVPQRPHGMMYQGVFTVPFTKFSFVIKIQCREGGMTGVREAMLFEDRMRGGEEPNVSGAGLLFPGWNPDAVEFDARFPKHPVSRVRRLLEHVARSAVMDGAVRGLAGFRLPIGG